jgi:hypothetical protein
MEFTTEEKKFIDMAVNFLMVVLMNAQQEDPTKVHTFITSGLLAMRILNKLDVPEATSVAFNFPDAKA